MTPDSFSDGGTYSTISSAVTHANNMIKHRVDIIDIGIYNYIHMYTFIYI